MDNENTEGQEAELLARIMGDTELLSDEEKGEIPQLEETEEVPEVEDEAEDEVEEDENSEDEVDEAEEAGEEDDDDAEDSDEESSEPELLSEDEVDWEYTIPVVIDGETQHLSLEEVRKGYATQQHLSNQGRELGEARKKAEAERTEKLQEVEQLAFAMNETLSSNEQALANQYHQIDQQIAEARTEGDTYKVQELKDQREVAQQRYWSVRQQREAVLGQYSQAKQQADTEEWNQKVQHFFDGIQEVIPEYDDEYANSLREFGQEVGISEDYMLTIVDPTIVKVLDDYRKLKQGVTTGAKKRVKAPVKKAPTKKARSEKQKKASKENMTKARAFREDASQEDQMDFLRQYAQQSLGDNE